MECFVKGLGYARIFEDAGGIQVQYPWLHPWYQVRMVYQHRRDCPAQAGSTPVRQMEDRGEVVDSVSKIKIIHFSRLL